MKKNHSPIGKPSNRKSSVYVSLNHQCEPVTRTSHIIYGIMTNIVVSNFNRQCDTCLICWLNCDTIGPTITMRLNKRYSNFIDMRLGATVVICLSTFGGILSRHPSILHFQVRTQRHVSLTSGYRYPSAVASI